MEFFNLSGMEIKNVRAYNDNLIFFTLSGNGLRLGNLKLIRGKKGWFIGMPSEKSKNEYYDIYNIYLSKEDGERIVKAVLAQVPKQEDSNNKF